MLSRVPYLSGIGAQANQRLHGMAIRKCQIVLLLGALLLAACSIAEAPTGFEPAPTLKTPVSFSAPISRPNLPARAERIQAVVVNVVDGDTIDVSIKDQTFRIRYIGIDTPETVHPTKPEEPYGREASARNKELVAGKTVQLEKDVSETDRFGRLLRYVWLDESTMVNAVLLVATLMRIRCLGCSIIVMATHLPGKCPSISLPATVPARR